MTPPDLAQLAATLQEHRAAFRAFLASRLGNEADAEDLLQTSLVKALQRADEIRDDEKIVPWFYQVLRHAMIDHVRSRRAALQREEAWSSQSAALADDPEAERHLCACFEKLLPTLKPAQAELLRRVELHDEAVGRVATALGISANRASVTLHRARAELRKRLIEFCGDCVCLDECVCD